MRKCLLLAVLATISISQECSDGIELWSSGCSSSEDCSDINGHALTCVKNVCMCPVDMDCAVSSSTGHVAEFGDCTKGSQCVDGHGGSIQTGQREKSCAQRIKCFQKKVGTGEAPVARCLTCSSCKAQNDGGYDCLAQCQDEFKDDSSSSIEEDTSDVSDLDNSSMNDLDPDNEEEEKNQRDKSLASNTIVSFPIVYACLVLLVVM